MNELHLFAGAGGGILGGMLLGHTCICAVEIEPYCRKVLLQRQRDGILPKFPIWDDVRTFDGKPWRGLVDVVCGGFPCQDISCAGKGAGIEGKQSGLWAEMARIVGEIRPKFALVENSPMLLVRGIDRVLGDLAEIWYDARWGVLSCRDVGGVHLRERIFIFAANARVERCDKRENYRQERPILSNASRIPKNQPERNGRQRGFDSNPETDASDNWIQRIQRSQPKEVYRFQGFPWGEDVGGIEDLRNRSDIPEPLIRRIGHDVAEGVDRLKAIGNGQIPRVVRVAWETLMP